jgi:hypothetical protein
VEHATRPQFTVDTFSRKCVRTVKLGKYYGPQFYKKNSTLCIGNNSRHREVNINGYLNLIISLHISNKGKGKGKVVPVLN